MQTTSLIQPLSFQLILILTASIQNAIHNWIRNEIGKMLTSFSRSMKSIFNLDNSSCKNLTEFRSFISDSMLCQFFLGEFAIYLSSWRFAGACMFCRCCTCYLSKVKHLWNHHWLKRRKCLTFTENICEEFLRKKRFLISASDGIAFFFSRFDSHPNVTSF